MFCIQAIDRKVQHANSVFCLCAETISTPVKQVVNRLSSKAFMFCVINQFT